MISKAIKYRVEILMMYEHLTEEIEDLLKNADFNANSVLYKNVKRFKLLKAEIAKETDARKQLMKLITLREELVKQLNINY
jgi:arsenate reductase-like glutaredoxin family protein